MRGVLVADPGVLCPVAGLLKPEGHLRLLASSIPRDGQTDLSPDWLRKIAGRYAECGLELDEARPAARSDIVASRSAWAKRLGPARPVVFARYSRSVKGISQRSGGPPAGL